jgi:hypothetical protein
MICKLNLKDESIVSGGIECKCMFGEGIKPLTPLLRYKKEEDCRTSCCFDYHARYWVLIGEGEASSGFCGEHYTNYNTVIESMQQIVEKPGILYVKGNWK